ncbi:methyltransferase domain-containing protein [Streptomyces sp. RerS4]|uniref:class I SAM-dependent methyltransferase n=1 Tax=Streptomyces sp. RerS4 TaxID=2942449 RepID=UPI00201C15A5|nr:methyltransferase domain-containing protein [Streptomyces sp. RerS4]UQX04422.1 methyltransferase domain-containing protein [Streptomyces sp. RerS4]
MQQHSTTTGTTGTTGTTDTAGTADTANTGQAQAWNGYEGAHWAAHHDRWNAVNAGFDGLLFEAAAIRPAEHVLDIGCGAGATTRLAARAAGGGRAVGLDLSGPMLEQARAVAAREGVANASFVHGDAQVHPLPRAAFDVAISRFGVMFFADPAAAFAHIASALRPGGRVAFLCTAAPEENQWLTELAALGDILPIGGFGAPGGPGMFSLADAEVATGLLRSAGLRDVRAEHVEAYGTWGRDARDAADFLLDSGPGRHLLGQVDPATRTLARQRLTRAFRPYESDGAVRLRSTGRLLTATVPA